MLTEKLATLVKQMETWQQKVAANPQILDQADMQVKDNTINDNLPKMQHMLAEANYGTPDVETKRVLCLDLLRQWDKQQALAITQQMDFFIDNYLHYFVSTVGQEPLDNIDVLLSSYLASTISSVTGDGLKMLARNVIGEAVEVGIVVAFISGGATIGTIPGALIGLFIGITVDYLVSVVSKMMFGDPQEIGEAKMRGDILDFMSKSRAELKKNMNSHLQKLEQLIKSWSKELAAVDDLNTLNIIERKLRNNIATAKNLHKQFSATNHPLGNRLLKEWVLQNMGDDNDEANDYDYNVTEPTWKLAVQTLKDEGFLKKTTEDQNKIKNELTASVIDEELAFLSQVRNELSHAGIRLSSPVFASWEKEVQQYARSVKGDMQKIVSKFDNKKLQFYNNGDITDGTKFVTHIEETYDGNLISDMKEKEMIRAVAYRSVQFGYSVQISLSSKEGTIFCDAYYYSLTGSGVHNGRRIDVKTEWKEYVDWF